MKENILQWRHVFKLDPDRQIHDRDLELICTSGSDAIIVGGSSGVTYENTQELLSRLRKYQLPCALEISSLAAVTPGFDLYMVPFVLNAGEVDWMMGQHHAAVKHYGDIMPWDEVLSEGYVILNPDSTAAKVTHALSSLDAEDVIAYARLAERMFRMPIFYIEYSGMFGDMDIIQQVAAELHETRLFYGGGIDSLEKAEQAGQFAHTVVVGNIIYEDISKALETVKLKPMGKGLGMQ